MKDQIAEWAMELQSIAQAGLYYSHDVFDQERYQRVRQIAVEMMAMRTDIPAEKLTELFCGDIGYQTPKVDTRAVLFQQDRILLVRERTGEWSLPGGWCDYNLSPMDNTIKEAKEEAGLDVIVKRVISVQDREKHNLPPYPYHVVKIFFLCESAGGTFMPNIETSDACYFPEDALPPLASEKTNEEQVKMCFEAWRQADRWEVQFD